MTDLTQPSRREFLQTSTAATLAGSLIVPAALSTRAYAGVSDTLRVGLIGCGGRGTGAASDALHANPRNELVAVGDIFEDRLEGSLSNLQTDEKIRGQLKVDNDHKFIGLDAYKQVIEASDVVLLTTPPGFRPLHLRAAVEAGKHIFTEKPMATDAPGVRSVMESVALAKQKGLGILAGFCWRYDEPRRAIFRRIHDGEIGDLLAVYGTYLTGPVQPMPPADAKPASMTPLQWQVRNWYNFTYLSGDGLVEQAVHTVDWLGWAFKDKPPAQCTAVGGRQVPANGGNIFDHIEVNYEWDTSARGFIAQRQIAGCHNENNCTFIGSRGMGFMNGRGVYITGPNAWKYDGPGNNMYRTEHAEFFASLRAGQPLNDGDRMVNSTLMAIMGRMAGYTGKQITWEMAMNSEESLMPDISDWSMDFEPPKHALPGITPFF